MFNYLFCLRYFWFFNKSSDFINVLFFLGNEISVLTRRACGFYSKNKYFKKKNVFHRPWGSYTNLFKGKEFLIKELFVKPKGILSLQKHFHRAEHWVVTHGIPKITLNKSKFLKKPGETIYIPLGAIHRIENPFKKPVKIIEAQIGSILKETDIVRYQDVYGRVK